MPTSTFARFISPVSSTTSSSSPSWPTIRGAPGKHSIESIGDGDVSTLQSGQRLLHYDVVEKVGAGGMGEVYRALDSKLGRSVAIKVLPAPTAGDAVSRQRFLQEARSVSALNHPGIVTVHAIESEADVDFLVMEYIQGRTLAELLAAGSVPFAQVLEIGA